MVPNRPARVNLHLWIPPKSVRNDLFPWFYQGASMISCQIKPLITLLSGSPTGWRKATLNMWRGASPIWTVLDRRCISQATSWPSIIIFTGPETSAHLSRRCECLRRPECLHFNFFKQFMNNGNAWGSSLTSWEVPKQECNETEHVQILLWHGLISSLNILIPPISSPTNYNAAKLQPQVILITTKFLPPPSIGAWFDYSLCEGWV